jgi:hypothetical protein
MMIRTYSELRRLSSFEDRFNYLMLRGTVGAPTFGFDRWMNQQFYASREWRLVRDHIIVRDNGCDLGADGYEMHDRIYIHHMNPMAVAHIAQGDEDILDPEFLIATSHKTHNAIHYGDDKLLERRTVVIRKPGDTKLW